MVDSREFSLYGRLTTYFTNATRYKADGEEDMEYRLLHVYFSAKRTIANGGGASNSPQMTAVSDGSPSPGPAPTHSPNSEKKMKSPIQGRTPVAYRHHNDWNANYWPPMRHPSASYPWYGGSPPKPVAATPRYPNHFAPPWAQSQYTHFHRYHHYYSATQSRPQHEIVQHETSALNPEDEAPPSPATNRADPPTNNHEDEDESFPFPRFHPVVEPRLSSSDDSFSFDSTSATPISSPSRRQRREINLTPIRSPPALKSKRLSKLKNGKSDDVVSPLSSPPFQKKSRVEEHFESAPSKSFDLDAASFNDDMLGCYGGDCWNDSVIPFLRTSSSPLHQSNHSNIASMDEDASPLMERLSLPSRLEKLQSQIDELIREAPSREKDSLVSSVSNWAGALLQDRDEDHGECASSLKDDNEQKSQDALKSPERGESNVRSTEESASTCDEVDDEEHQVTAV